VAGLSNLFDLRQREGNQTRLTGGNEDLSTKAREEEGEGLGILLLRLKGGASTIEMGLVLYAAGFAANWEGFRGYNRAWKEQTEKWALWGDKKRVSSNGPVRR